MMSHIDARSSSGAGLACAAAARSGTWCPPAELQEYSSSSAASPRRHLAPWLAAGRLGAAITLASPVLLAASLTAMLLTSGRLNRQSRAAVLLLRFLPTLVAVGGLVLSTASHYWHHGKEDGGGSSVEGSTAAVMARMAAIGLHPCPAAVGMIQGSSGQLAGAAGSGVSGGGGSLLWQVSAALASARMAVLAVLQLAFDAAWGTALKLLLYTVRCWGGG